MADFALRLKVFIASPGDVTEERDIAEEEIQLLAQQCSRKRLLVQPFRWENGVTPGYERPQQRIDRELRTAELTVVILWSRLGSAASLEGDETGTQEELRLAGERVSRGYSDDVFVYFKTAPPPRQADPEDVRRINVLKSTLQASKRILTVDVASPEAFQLRLRHDLSLWAERWHGVPEICEYAALHSPPEGDTQDELGENRLSSITQWFQPETEPDMIEQLGRAVVEAYQTYGPEAYRLPISQQALASSARWKLYTSSNGDASTELAGMAVRPSSRPCPLVKNGSEVFFAHREWFWFFCADGLVQAVSENHIQAVSRRPYVNPVHQYFKALAGDRRERIVANLRRWLTNFDGSTRDKPIARNFAAYVLGMLDAIEAQDDLARAIYEDQGAGVRLYCITSLGKLRARRQLPLLVQLFFDEAEQSTRLTAAQAVCRMVGFRNFEL